MNCTGKRCPMQYGKVDPATCESVKYCPEATPPKTNADRIRAMSDDELAKFLSEYTDCICGVYTQECGTSEDTCIARWLEWLKEEVKHESN